jgi:phosphonate transport system substrate-binding protein
MERTINSKQKPRIVGALVAVVLIAGVAIAARYIDPGSAPYTPSVLRIGVLPDQNPETLQQKYGPLVEYLAAQTGSQTRLVIPADYYDAIRLFSEGKVDLAYFGGLTFVQAQAGFNAEALVMREIDTRFSSWFLVRSEHARQHLSDFRGKRLGFGSNLSTSGHLMPRHFLRQRWQIDAESYFSDVSYSGAHDKTVLQVREGKVDVGAVNSLVVKKMIADGRLAPDTLHVLWQTPPYPDYVWVVRESLDDGFKTRLRDAFLSLDADDPSETEVLAGLNAKIFLPADPGDFGILRETAVSLELMDKETE